MNLRVQGSDLPEGILKEVGSLLGRAILHPSEVNYLTTTGTVSFLLERFPILERSFLGHPRQSKEPVPCRVTIRNVTDCQIDEKKQLQSICILFGVRFREKTIFFSSREKDGGEACYALTCRTSGIDIAIVDQTETPASVNPEEKSP